MPSEVAKILLEIKAVHLQPNDFFTWTSGIKSPIYCDNRMIISHPTQRRTITNLFVENIKQNFPQTNCIAGTATAGIPWAAWIAEAMQLPMVYIRSKAKDYGRKSAIEGDLKPGANVVIIEDLISTGKSSIAACAELRKEDISLQGVTSIFTYGLPIAEKKFNENDVKFSSLCSLQQMLEYARAKNLLNEQEVGAIDQWRNQIEIT